MTNYCHLCAAEVRLYRRGSETIEREGRIFCGLPHWAKFHLIQAGLIQEDIPGGDYLSAEYPCSLCGILSPIHTIGFVKVPDSSIDIAVGAEHYICPTERYKEHGWEKRIFEAFLKDWDTALRIQNTRRKGETCWWIDSTWVCTECYVDDHEWEHNEGGISYFTHATYTRTEESLKQNLCVKCGKNPSQLPPEDVESDLKRIAFAIGLSDEYA